MCRGGMGVGLQTHQLCCANELINLALVRPCIKNGLAADGHIYVYKSVLVCINEPYMCVVMTNHFIFLLYIMRVLHC